ncbi:MAG TPA: PD-(D/E)XK nuclease family protein [Thermoanaerobaculia bacterium]|nr:PD-(D/E)XK nuclease family protein [Thermoanaerobaculia bacterium]
MAQQLDLFDFPPAPPPSKDAAAVAARRGRLLCARGPLAAEAVLLAEIERLLAEAEREPALLGRPVRVVVPSRSLRRDVAAAIGRQRGRGAAGLVVQTLFGLALEILERAGEEAPRGAALFEIVARRAARAEPVLRRGLDDLIEGYGAAVATIRDLLDAGLEPAHVAAADEALAADGRAVASPADVERARALVRAAGSAAEGLERLGSGRASDLLRRAADRLLRAPESLPARAVIVHGFAEATGVASDLIEALARTLEATVLIDRPPDFAPRSGGEPPSETEPRLEGAFTQRLAERLAAVSGAPAPAGPEPLPPRLDTFVAGGTDAEVREVALRLGGLIDSNVPPERIGVVARDLGPYRFAIRRHFERLGIPASGLGVQGGLTPAGRRLRALGELLKRGGEAPVSRWLDAVVGLPGAGRPGFDLRLAFAAIGAGRLRDAADLKIAGLLTGGAYALPIRQGFSAGADEGAEDAEIAEEGAGAFRSAAAARAPRRRISGARLESAVAAARRLGERLARWPEAAPAADHLRRLRALLIDDLGWNPGDRDLGAAFAALEMLATELPRSLPLVQEELWLLVDGALAGLGAAPFGGRGGGVQVLSVTEARARTFEHLFVLGVNRDAFPRPIREDALLPDSLRRVLRRVLPDVPEKRGGFDEERYLFAQLLSAAPAVTLSWQSTDEDGKVRAPSPLVERIGLTAGERRRAPALFSAAGEGAPSAALRRPAWEHAVLAALHGPRQRFAAVLPAAVGELFAEIRADGVAGPTAGSVARARCAALAELDPDLRTPEGRAIDRRLGPWFGFVGPLEAADAASALDPRRRELSVTHLERLSGCPWQFFLTRLLAIEPTPDPLQALPGLDARLVGNLVHAVLDRTAAGSGEEAGLAAIRERLAAGVVPPPVPWPGAAEIARFLAEESVRLVAEEGIALPGLARALAARAEPYLAAARAEWDAAGGFLAVVASEVEGEVVVADPDGERRRLSFRADRADLLPGGGLLITDWKTGRPISTKKSEERRRADFLAEVRAGSKLQAVAYRRSAGPASRGRYLFLRPDLAGELREFATGAGDADLDAAFERAIGAGLGAHAAGSFFPRLVEPDGQREPRRCEYCEVAEACLRGDSGARRRLVAWAARADPEGPAGAALLGVWGLAAAERAEGGT